MSNDVVSDFGFTVGRGLRYRVTVRADPQRGGYTATLVSSGIGTIMEPNGKSPSDALTRLIQDLRQGDSTDRAIAKEAARYAWFQVPKQAESHTRRGNATSHATKKLTFGEAPIIRLAEGLTPYRSKYGHGAKEWQSGFDYAKEAARHETHAEMRSVQRRLVEGARTDFDRGMLAGYAELLGDTPPSRLHARIKKPARKKPPRGRVHSRKKVAYRLKLSPSELRAVEFAQGRYEWADMLAKHAAEDGTIAFSESEMGQWCDDVDADDARFPLAAGPLANKLESFYESRI